MSKSVRHLLLAPYCMLALACGERSNGPPQDNGVFISAEVAGNPENTISAIVSVVAVGYDSAYVEYWVEGSTPKRTPAVSINPADSTAEIPVLGLDTLTAYVLELRLQRGADLGKAVDTLQFSTGEYPAWIPRAGVSGSDTTPGYLLVSYPDGAVIIDNLGKILWYRYRPGGALGSWTAQGGVYTWLSAADSSGYFVHDALGRETGRLACEGPYNTRFHDVLVTDADGVWIMCDAIRTMDLSGVGGMVNAQVFNALIQHHTPDGIVDWEWEALDHMEITDLALERREGVAVNFNHSNAIALDTDGNILISSRSLNEITKISRATGEIMWRFGGLANEFTIINDTKGFFAFQHGLRSVGPNQIQLLDNGTAAPSRVVRYQLDPVAKTATLVMDFQDTPTTFASVGGSTQAIAGGAGLVSFGPAGRVMEFSSAGQKRWELTGIAGRYVFRTQRITDLYHPGH